MKSAMKSFCYAAGLSLCLAGVTHAEQVPGMITTDTFLQTCAASAQPESKSFCHGFAQGVYEAYLVSRHPKSNPHFICIQDQELSRTKILSNFEQWINANPNYKEFAAADTLLRYLSVTHPCKAKK